jgi:DNA-directed RNA polymerase specialized sigma subunit
MKDERFDRLSFIPHPVNAKLLAKRLNLDGVERRIVMLYYAEELGIAEIAEVLGMTAYRVASMHRQIVARATAHLAAELAPRVRNAK